MPLFSPLIALLPAAAPAICPPEGTTQQSLHALRDDASSLDETGQRARLALALTACMDASDPVLRDDLGFGLLSGWMRAGALDTHTLRTLRDAGFARLEREDGEGFGKPFAALLLAEVSRTDRIAAWMTQAEREAMVERACSYLRDIDDYRGFDAAHGWRHGVAHGSDWLMQLALNPALDKAQADLMLASVADQVVPASGHAYVEGEYERLARPVLHIAGRRLHARDEWRAWFSGISERLGDASIAWRDSGWIARRHNLHGFLASLNAQLSANPHPAYADLQTEAVEAMKALP
ncbi:DUF2785 domain-containing protein [Xanthomonadaceae bacterium JHOS43]|nr:DUF2785 domain-containing protein [Xanthomonadaceae bacterium JHOS43]MCX7562272.1 DUF2785 domain-containing protein [Xanthomonadaceae bacterium XH05]